MQATNKIQALLQDCCEEVFLYIQQRESWYQDGMVPATDVNTGLGINFSAVPKNSKDPNGQKGWLLATLARMLEDDGRITLHKKGTRVLYKTLRP